MFYVNWKDCKGSKYREKSVTAFVVDLQRSLTISAWYSEDVFISEIFILKAQKESREHISSFSLIVYFQK